MPRFASFVFGLTVTEGVDDFRVIIDYGDSFPPNLSFDISAFELTTLGTVPPRVGYRIGNEDTPTVPGSGNYGDEESVLGIALTGRQRGAPANFPTLPVPACQIKHRTALKRCGAP